MLGILRQNSKEVDSIRCLSLDMIANAKSGHSGIALGAAPIIYTLYAKHLFVDPKVPDFINRDRFVLSCGHASALLYATLYMAGFEITLDDLKKYRQIATITPGHPEYGLTKGVDMTTGALGQGIASAVGMAIAEAYLNNQYPEIINHYTYVLCSDGDLMEGVSYEATSLAGSLGLNKLIVLYDSNNSTIDGPTKNVFDDNITSRFESINWNTITVANGEDIDAISKAIDHAKNSDKPTLIKIETTIGKYSNLENSNLSHSYVFTFEEISIIKNKLDIRDLPFTVSDEAKASVTNDIYSRTKDMYATWSNKFANLPSEDQQFITTLISNDKVIDFTNLDYSGETTMEQLRVTCGNILNALAKRNKVILAGSADVSSSTKVTLADLGTFTKANRQGQNILFGVREHAMAAIANGLALCGLRPIISTFLTFSDYLKPALRFSALMKLPILYIFTHDSITIGADGPTHQPVEQLASLRTIPNLEVFRPADANEMMGTYKYLSTKNEYPTALIVSKESLPVLETTSISEVSKGAYIVQKELKEMDALIIATGEEVHTGIDIANKLFQKGFNIRVVSMPSIERFIIQPKDYQEEIIPVTAKVFVVEAGSSYSWYRFVYNDKFLMTINNFGYSGESNDIKEKMGFTSSSIADRIEKILTK